MIEWAQKGGHKLSFEIGAEGGRGNKDFVAQVVLDGKVFATGSGFSKKKAEQAAAQNAINKIKERNRPAEAEAERKQHPNQNRRPDRPQDSREIRSEKQARLAPRRDGERPTQENREFKRENERPIAERRPVEEAKPNTPAANAVPRPQRPGRINQEDLYNEAAPLPQVPRPEAGNIEPTLPRPERAERTQRRERPPKRDRNSNPIQDSGSNVENADPSTWTLDEGYEKASGEKETGTGFLEPRPFAEAKMEFEEPRRSRPEPELAKAMEEPAHSQPEEAPSEFVVNAVRIQPKAVEVAVPLPQMGSATSSKKKWQNVSKSAEEEESQADNATSLAQQAFNSMTSEADAFFAQTPEKPSSEEEQRATEA
jgi:hypothetical protein